MKVYCVYHCVDHEGSDLVGVYASSVKAYQERDRLTRDYVSKRSDDWALMSKNEQKMWGNYERYAFEHWEVDEHEVIE